MTTSTPQGIPYWIERVQRRRVEIYAFIYGAKNPSDGLDNSNSYTMHYPNATSVGSATTVVYYIPEWDPNATSFLPFDEGLRRLRALISDFENEYSDLLEAEKKMKDPFGDRLTLVEFFDFKAKMKKLGLRKIFERQQPSTFKNHYEIDKYCREFNCTGQDTSGLCNKCATTSEGRMCKTYTTSSAIEFGGDPATFYYDLAKESETYIKEEVSEERECEIERKEKEKGYPLGEIPIGELVDETEEFASSVSSTLNAFYGFLVEIKNKSLSARDEGDLAIKDAWKLIDLTSEGADNTQDCVVNCEDVPCTCSCSCNYDTGCSWSLCSCGSCSGCSLPYHSCVASGICYLDHSTTTQYNVTCRLYTATCSQCSGTVCPFLSIDAKVKSISEHYSNVVTLRSELEDINDEDINDNLPSLYSDFKHLINGSISPNRCALLDKLTISRERLQAYDPIYSPKGCPSIYEIAPRGAKVKGGYVLNCRMALDLEKTGELDIRPDFLFPDLNCYPFGDYHPSTFYKLTPAQQSLCRSDRDSSNCFNAIKDLLDNYYCCRILVK
jgi:hypothetical protein